MASQQPFRFLDLLPELRCLIYELVLVQSDPVTIFKRSSEQGSLLMQPLLHTNRQIREEAAPFWYSHNVFITPCATRFLECSWLDIIGQANLDLLKEFRFEFIDWKTLQPTSTFLTVRSARDAIQGFISKMEAKGLHVDKSVFWLPVGPVPGWEGVRWVSSDDTKGAPEKAVE